MAAMPTGSPTWGHRDRVRDPSKQASEEGSLSLRRGIPIFLLGARALPAGSSERELLAN